MTTSFYPDIETELLAAQAKAEMLFRETEQCGLIKPGISERELSDKIYALAQELFGIRKYWHKRIVRAGKNTLCPYRENPPNLIIQKDDLVFFDFGPVFEEWEADFGRTYLLGADPIKQKMIDDLEIVFKQSKQFYSDNKIITGSQLFDDVTQRSKKYGWLYGGPHAGHLIGIFPHEKLLGECPENYICPENNKPMRAPDINGNPRHWILEVHLVNQQRTYGAFYEQLLTLSEDLFMLICPYCEQDDVWEVQFVGLEQKSKMCFECETVWNETEIIKDGTGTYHDDFMAALGHAPDWTQMIKIRKLE